MDRLEKNKQIAQTIKETYTKCKSQDCKCFKFKIDKSNLSKEQAIHAANNMIYFYLIYNKLDRSGTDQTSIKGSVKIVYNKFVSKLVKQEDTTYL